MSGSLSMKKLYVHAHFRYSVIHQKVYYFTWKYCDNHRPTHLKEMGIIFWRSFEIFRTEDMLLQWDAVSKWVIRILLECFLLILLSPANEVWDKVIFLHLFVILFTGECAWAGGHAWPGGHAWLGGMHGQGACMPEGAFMARGMHGWGVCMAGGVCVAGGGMHGWGACVTGGACHACPIGLIPWDTVGQRAAGTHPTGMHSCFLNSFPFYLIPFKQL